MAATPTLNVNQFAQIPVLGQLDLETQGTVFTGATSVNQVTALVAGQPVTVENSGGGVPKVLSLASAAVPANAVVVRNLKDTNFPASARVELAGDGTVVWLLSNGAINRWAAVEADTTTAGNVGPALGVNPTLGIAFDQATGTGQLIRVLLQLPKTQPSAGGALRVAQIVATLAQINAGLVLIPGVAGKKITVVNYVGKVAGAFASGTSVELESTNGTPVAVSTVLEAALTNGATLLPSAPANTTLGAGFGVPLGTGDGLQIVNNGSAQTVGTSITLAISYFQG